MSELKCWKKISDEKWVNKNKTELLFDKMDDYWSLLVFSPKDEDADNIFTTPSKKEATQFAKKYMKNHDRC